ncbi:hypothetical protein [Alkaliphilus sp. B6464]|uniref:hypothetical protein n=1 Tax=Alkaliphilus sp. B6464 TaxID=2731219 RepID=UPI001BAA9BAD|nr:hypothetical protein [Alkaliphilus sp. B6464]QUH21783.1 hypothetical protein HYG84_17765 [Alkaliphilus sp. B6464]
MRHRNFKKLIRNLRLMNEEYEKEFGIKIGSKITIVSDRNLNEIEGTIKMMYPNKTIKIETSSGDLILSLNKYKDKFKIIEDK